MDDRPAGLDIQAGSSATSAAQPILQAPMSASAPPAPSGTALARASALNLLARLTSGAATLGLAVLTTNVLDTHGRGVYALLTTWAGIAATVITGGTTVLAADLIHRRHDEPVLHGATVAIGVGSALVLVPACVLVGVLTGGATLAALASTALLTALVTYSSFEMAIAQANGDVLRVSLTDIGMAVAPFIVTVIVAVLFEPTPGTLIAAWAAGAAVTAAVQFADVLRAGSLLLRRAWRVAASIMRRSIRVALANGTSLLCSRIDVFVVAAVISVSAAGVYSIPVALAANLLLLSRALLTASYRSIMTAPEEEVAARMSTALRHSVIVVLVGGGLSLPVVAVAAGAVFGDAYAGIWQPYAFLVPASACICVVELLRHFLLTRLERQNEFALVVTGMLVVNGVLAAAGAAAFGLPGAAASTTITYALAALALVSLCARTLAVSMRELAVPRWSDFAAYGRAVRSLMHRRRTPEAS
jgi:O-antigen/teichoic acid export membrane protein